MKTCFLSFRLLFSFFLTVASLGSNSLFAQTGSDAIEGVWLTDNSKAKFQIFKTTSGTYAGRIVWMLHPNGPDGKPKTDEKNPKETLRGRFIQNAILLTGLKWDADEEEYKDGRVYDPTSGKTYNCNAKIEGAELKLRGYVGISLLGKTTSWTRTTN